MATALRLPEPDSHWTPVEAFSVGMRVEAPDSLSGIECCTLPDRPLESIVYLAGITAPATKGGSRGTVVACPRKWREHDHPGYAVYVVFDGDPLGAVSVIAFYGKVPLRVLDSDVASPSSMRAED